MHNHRKLKGSFFLRDDLYPERLLSRHKHHKKSGLYAALKSQPLPSSSLDASAFDTDKSSKMLLQGISELYRCQTKFGNNLLDKEKGLQSKALPNAHTSLSANNLTTNPLPATLHLSSRNKCRGLQEMGDLSFTNGLLESGHRYFRMY